MLDTNSQCGRAVGKPLQSLHRHCGAQVRAADADVDHQLERLLGAAGDPAGAHRLGERQHALALGHDLLFDLGAADPGTRRLAQGDVQYGAIFGLVDLVAAPHGIDALAQLPTLRPAPQLGQHDLIDTLAREIHQTGRRPRGRSARSDPDRGQTARASATALRRVAFASRSVHVLVRGPGMICTTAPLNWRWHSTAPKECRNRIHDVLYLCFRQLRENRQRQRFLGSLLGLREVAGSVAQVREALLQVQRQRIVDLRARPRWPSNAGAAGRDPCTRTTYWL